MLSDLGPPPAGERVLPTLNVDGSRRWIRPRLSKGKWLRRRFAAAWGLILVFVLLPHVQVGGKPAILLDVARREFTFFGRTFIATDGLVLMLAMIAIFASVFLVTAVVGRAWCGWACPQTVYMEMVFRPIERLVEGPPAEQRRIDREGPNARRALKLAVFAGLAAILANTFLSYFVGWDDLVHWMLQSPVEHPGPFLVMLVTTALVFTDFAWFREQTCVVACPYGRLQSALLDKDSLIVGYDPARGEPRCKPAAARDGRPAGDCVDCAACVTTCPTGIDIRDGLQMECVGCTQCIDACDAIMSRVGRPAGLIRYTSQARLAGRPSRVLRPRVLAYAAIVVLAVTGLGLRIGLQPSADVTLLRRSEVPFAVLEDGRISNLVRVKVVNRTGETRTYRLAVDAPGAELRAPRNPVPIEAGADTIIPAFAVVPRASFAAGQLAARVIVTDDAGFETAIPFTLLGPE